MSDVSWAEVLATSQVDGTTLTAAAAASALPPSAKYTFPGLFFNYIGQQILIKATGRISVVVTTPGTARFDVRLGSTVVFDSLAMALDPVAYTNVGFALEILLTVRVVGSSAQFFGQGTFASPILAGNPATPPKGSLTALLPWNSAPAVGTAFDATASQTLDLFFTQTVTTGSMTLHQFSLLSLN